MNNGIAELAKMFKNCQNPPPVCPVFGKIEELPTLKIRRNAKVVLTAAHIKSLIDLYETDIEGRYIHSGATVAMLPYDDDNNYLVLGVVQNG